MFIITLFEIVNRHFPFAWDARMLVLMIALSDRWRFEIWSVICWDWRLMFLSIGVICCADDDEAMGWVSGAAIGGLKWGTSLRSGLFGMLYISGSFFESSFFMLWQHYWKFRCRRGKKKYWRHLLACDIVGFSFFPIFFEHVFLVVCYFLLQSFSLFFGGRL